MQLYAFPNPDYPEQAHIIQALGSQENELQKVFIEVNDWEKLRVSYDLIKSSSIQDV